jgi:SH3 domain protein
MTTGIVLLIIALTVNAETVYVTNQLQLGLHADKSETSPITALVNSGTALELIKTEDKLSYVRTAEGKDGWVDTSYLIKTDPGNTSPSVAVPLNSDGAAGTEVASLEQQLKSERVKTGELQVQIAELRKRLGQDGSNDSLYEKIDQLAVEKKQLEIQLAQLLEGSGQLLPVPDAEITEPGGLYNPRNAIIALVVALIAGVIAGLYLMDFLYRRRHGGFRV